MKKTVIIGGGLGGLSAAITLQHAGFQVQLFEKNKHFGGKLMPVQLGDYSFDFGPNTITMPNVFEQVIEQTGEKAGDYFEFVKLPVHTRNVFSDGSEFKFSSNPEMMEEEIQKLDSKGARNYGDFLRETGRIFHLAEKQFFPRIFHSWRDYLSPSLALSLAKVRPWETLDRFHRRYFCDERVIQALNRYATYVGSSPYRLPATFAMIAYLELVEGVYYVKGGNVRIAGGFEKLARKLGADLFAETEVQKILVSNRQVRGVQLANGEKIEADYVLVNGDLLESYPMLVEKEYRPRFADQRIKSMEPSLSAFVILAGISGCLSGLQHHNVYFSSNYPREFQALFQENRYPEEPTIYICSSSRTEPERSPGGDNLFIRPTNSKFSMSLLIAGGRKKAFILRLEDTPYSAPR